MCVEEELPEQTLAKMGFQIDDETRSCFGTQLQSEVHWMVLTSWIAVRIPITKAEVF